MSRVNVVKQPFTWRDVEVGRLSGVIRAIIVVERYVHVSTGRERVEVRTPISNIETQLKNIEQKLMSGDVSGLEYLTRAISIGYIDNVTYGELVCIPGSTIKGLLRSRLELCPSRNGVSISCIQSEKPPITQPIPQGQHGWRHVRIWRDAVAEDRGPACNPIQTQDYSLCKTCDLFGAPGIIGRISPGNFCCDRGCCEPRDLPYGEKVYAIKPGTRLEGTISFNSLAVEELGILFIAMGIKRGSIVGVPILIGKHKYAYKDMGVAHFELDRIEFPYRFRDILETLGVSFAVEGYRIVCRGSDLQKLVDVAIDRALQTYPQLEYLHGFSDARVRDQVIQ